MVLDLLMYMHVHVCTCMYMYVHVCTCMYMYMYMYVHIHTCIYMYMTVCTCSYMISAVHIIQSKGMMQTVQNTELPQTRSNPRPLGF